MSDDNIQVGIRIRPLVQSERDRGCQEAVQRIPSVPQVVVNRTENFTFNYVFDENDSQSNIYGIIVSPLLDKLMKGFNATILAYGQTGSGKTYTMGTAYDGNMHEDVGIIPRAISDIFEHMKKLAGDFEFSVTCSFMELYQEQLYDLLSSKCREESIVELRENKNSIVIPDLTECVVNSPTETFGCLLKGSSGRVVASTCMNEKSSRSHSIFTITIIATKKDEKRAVTTSKFHLVDLAGSERSKKTQATGDRFKEGVKINQGLLALGNVISTLGSGQGNGFVRYRDSKLTRLLQDSLGGNSITLMIACISPADYNVAETLSTLRYADRARKIKNKPIVNHDPHVAEVNQLKSIIQKLRVELLACGGSMTSSIIGELQNAPSLSNVDKSNNLNVVNSPSKIKTSKMYLELQEKYHNLQNQLNVTLQDVAENELRAHIAEAAHENLKTKTDEVKNIVEEFSKIINEDGEKKDYVGFVNKIQHLIGDISDDLLRTQTEIFDQKREFSHDRLLAEKNDDVGPNAEDTSTSREIQSLMQEHTDAYMSKQIKVKDQLRRINRDLDLKEELHQRIAGNLMKFNSLDDDLEVKFKECEKKIKELETERSTLQEKLRHINEKASAKLAEERRKRLQTLENEICTMKKTNMQQAKMLKMREKETQKIQTLNSDIQAMKESKVRLVRTMRREAENFRQWKLIREKELMALRNNDRKMQNKMVKQEQMYTRQKLVLKRKCDEAVAINKRLKDALERQSSAQALRQKMQSAKDANKIDQIITWVGNELDVIISLIDAECSLEQLMEDREIISGRIRDLKNAQEEAQKNSQESLDLGQELYALEEELNMRNAQITDFQQKVCVADLNTRINSVSDGVHSVAEARCVLKQLLKAILTLRREYATRSCEQKTALAELSNLREEDVKRIAAMNKRICLMQLEHNEALAQKENIYEEKVGVLLRQLYQLPQTIDRNNLTVEQGELLKIQEEQLSKVESLKAELESYKQMMKRSNMNGEGNKRSLKKIENKEKEILSSSDEEYYNDLNDPDWTKTPLPKRSRKTSKHNSRKPIDSESISSSSVTILNNVNNDTFICSNEESISNEMSSDTNRSTIEKCPPEVEPKRKSKICSCSGNCSTKRCGCRAIAKKCSLNCRCSTECCNDKFNKTEENSDMEVEKENEFKSPPPFQPFHKILKTQDSNKSNTLSFDATSLTPKVARTSLMTFSNPLIKKKNFN